MLCKIVRINMKGGTRQRCPQLDTALTSRFGGVVERMAELLRCFRRDYLFHLVPEPRVISDSNDLEKLLNVVIIAEPCSIH